VLVLPHADALGVDLHQFGQRVLQPAGDGDGAAQRDVELGELRARQIGGASTPRHPASFTTTTCGRGGSSSRSAAFTSVSVSRLAVPLPIGDELRGEALDHGAHGAGEAVLLMQVQRVGVHERAGGAHDGDLHAGAEARVEADHALLAGG
jgi:hypothetical protein